MSVEGEHKWSVETGGPIFSSPVLHPTATTVINTTSVTNNNRCIIFGCHDNNIYSVNLDTATHNKRCIARLSSPVFASVDVVNPVSGILVCAATSGQLCVLDKDGSFLASAYLPGNIFSSPLYLNDSVIVGCRDNYLYKFSIH